MLRQRGTRFAKDIQEHMKRRCASSKNMLASNGADTHACVGAQSAMDMSLKPPKAAGDLAGGTHGIFCRRCVWGSPGSIHLKPGHLKMAFFTTRCRLDVACPV